MTKTYRGEARGDGADDNDAGGRSLSMGDSGRNEGLKSCESADSDCDCAGLGRKRCWGDEITRRTGRGAASTGRLSVMLDASVMRDDNCGGG